MVIFLKSKSQNRGGLHLLSCVCSPVLSCVVGTIEVCRVEVVALYLPRVRVLSCLW